ncbi:Killer protein [Massilia cavernae]|uniref:Killer protein n=1 Tax=Massilia cavernae TaxID=2320864 RepID=A0A418Y0Z0_9BURK|nr:Killer protein [Massilia cavernae]
MITSIRHKGLAEFFYTSNRRGIPANFSVRLGRILDILDECSKPQEMDLPGYRFHALKGNRAGTYAVNVSANWRLTFQFSEANAVNVDLEDYH